MYVTDFLFGSGLSLSISFSIVVINFILREIMIVMIKQVGYHTETEQTRSIMVSIFVSQFFITAILILLTNANTQFTELSFLPFKGIYPDLTYEWYNDVAPTLLTTMLFNAVFPIIEFLGWFAIATALRWYDRGFTCKKDKTRKKTIP